MRCSQLMKRDQRSVPGWHQARRPCRRSACSASPGPPGAPGSPAPPSGPGSPPAGRGWPADCCAAAAVRGMRAKSSYTRCCCGVSWPGRGRSASGSAPAEWGEGERLRGGLRRMARCGGAAAAACEVMPPVAPSTLPAPLHASTQRTREAALHGARVGKRLAGGLGPHARRVRALQTARRSRAARARPPPFQSPGSTGPGCRPQAWPQPGREGVCVCVGGGGGGGEQQG